MRLTPRFHRGRCSGVPDSALPSNSNWLSTNRLERYGDAPSTKWNASHAFSVSSGVSAKICAIFWTAVVSVTTTA